MMGCVADGGDLWSLDKLRFIITISYKTMATVLGFKAISGGREDGR